MKITIVGAGDVGFQLANMLSKEEHDVCVIENDEALVGTVQEKLDARIIHGSGTNSRSLENAGVLNTDLFIAVSSVDEVNIMSCLLAKEFGVKRSVARVTNIDYVIDGSKLNKIELGIERVVNPQLVVAEEVCEICDFSDAAEVARFFNDKLYHLGYTIKIDNPLVGSSIQGLSLIKGEKKLIVTSIRRSDKTFVPKKNEVIKKGDTIFFFCLGKDIKKVRKHFGVKHHSTKKIFVIGGGKVGYQVARKLEETKHKVKVFDRDRRICNNIASDLDVEVFCTENTDTETLEGEGISSADVVVTMMSDDYSNILTALLAKKLGASKVISLVNSKKLTTLAYSLGVDSTISPRLATASSILKYIRRGNINSVVEKSEAEILELSIADDVKLTNSSIKDLMRPNGVIFGAVKRNNEIKLLSGADQVQKGDDLVVYVQSESISKLENLIQN